MKSTPSFAAVVLWLVLAPPALGQLNCSVGVEFYPEGGGIKRCILNGHHTLFTAAGLRVTCADNEELTQYPDGSLQSCVIVTAHDFGAVRCEPLSKVALEPDGRLRQCRRL